MIIILSQQIKWNNNVYNKTNIKYFILIKTLIQKIEKRWVYGQKENQKDK